ncbi:DUF3006 domain-containing protein [Halothermothrix orenii]|uniref:Uncharacterized protein n=1 Tax=Halothermothrix orenii (strain H 168 / OCM 544 / DSM 9562) TaxID=373903 RepID=B8CXY5_HALOH|nr:DUF3006 domain-containing protein [Halothermothrix orenii]ACL70154.1 hypothetical protein Hore_14050 [Halothermothrix orenii H 168]
MIIIDRFEGEKVILEYSNNQGKIITFAVPANVLPRKAKEGDILNIIIDNELTKQRKKRLEKIKDNLFENN